MPAVFKSAKGDPATEIVGVGVVPANGKGGVPVEQAAVTMAELQDKKGKPLSGEALTKAARKFADARGFRVEQVKDVDRLRQEAGAPPDRPPAVEVAQEAYRLTYAGLEPVNDDPDKQVDGGPDVGQPDTPDAQEAK